MPPIESTPVPLVILALATLLLLTWLLREPLFAEVRRARIRRRPFPAEWREHLRRRVPYFRSMPSDLQLQLKKHIQVFLAEKPFIGCAGLEVDVATALAVFEAIAYADGSTGWSAMANITSSCFAAIYTGDDLRHFVPVEDRG